MLHVDIQEVKTCVGNHLRDLRGPQRCHPGAHFRNFALHQGSFYFVLSQQATSSGRSLTARGNEDRFRQFLFLSANGTPLIGISRRSNCANSGSRESAAGPVRMSSVRPTVRSFRKY